MLCDGLNRTETLTDRQLWLLGLFAADGNVTDRGVITLSQSGVGGLARMKLVVPEFGYRKIFSHSLDKGNDVHRISFLDRSLASSLASRGFPPRKSLTLTYPKWLSESQHGPFMAGYIDGDGCVNIYDSGKTEYLLIHLVGTASFTESVNRLAPLQGRRRQIVRCKNLWEIRWTGRKAIGFGGFVWGKHPFGTKRRKYEVFNDTYQTKYTTYDPLRADAMKMLQSGIGAMQIAATLNLPFQTIYKWKSRMSAA